MLQKQDKDPLWVRCIDFQSGNQVDFSDVDEEKVIQPITQQQDRTMQSALWVIVHKETGETARTSDRKTINAVDREKYDVMTAFAYMAGTFR